METVVMEVVIMKCSECVLYDDGVACTELRKKEGLARNARPCGPAHKDPDTQSDAAEDAACSAQGND